MRGRGSRWWRAARAPRRCRRASLSWRALFCTLCESARLNGVDAQAYIRHAVNAALAAPGSVTLPHALLPTA